MRDAKPRSKSSQEAERDVSLAQDRLSQSLDALQDRYGPDGLIRSGVSYLRGDGREYVEAAWRRAQANPLSVVLIGIGLGWIAFGQGHGSTARSRPRPDGIRRQADRPVVTDDEPSPPDRLPGAVRVKTHRMRPNDDRQGREPALPIALAEPDVVARTPEPVSASRTTPAIGPTIGRKPWTVPPPPIPARSAYTRKGGTGSLEDWDPIANAHSVLPKPTQN